MNPILVESYRGEVLESFHRGVVCLVNERGDIIDGIGDVTQLCYPRSSLKLFQHIPLLMSGAVEKYQLTLEEIALMCGSHNGEKKHIEIATTILQKAGLKASSLQCGVQMPTLKEDIKHLYQSDLSASSLHNNCSGKHAGFLLYCVYKGYDIKGYLDLKHPLQQEILNVASQFYEYDKASTKSGIDGCSAPIFAYPVYNQAVAYKNLVSPTTALQGYKKALELIVEAVTQFPYMIGGKNRYCTQLMELAGDRVIGKTGADGVYCLALRKKKWGLTIKIDDGKMGPQYLVVQNILENLNIFTDLEKQEMLQYCSETMKNFGQMVTGELRASKAVKKFQLSKKDNV